MAKDVQLAGKDVGEVAEAGSTYGEKLLYGFKDAAQLDQVRAIAPVVAVPMVDQADAVIGRFARLAHALGVDLEGSHVRKAKRAFTVARERLTTAGERGLKVLCVAGYESEVYLAKPVDDPQLSYYQRLGVDFAQSGGTEYYWETSSWEFPALRAGQLWPWKFASMDYVDQARSMTQLAGWLTSARNVA